MDPDNCLLASNLVSKAYISQGSQALARRRRLIKSLLSQRKLPVEGWDEASIELFIQDAALMDSNNFIDNVGVGEREARVASPLVYRRHYGLAHGIGRSGDVAAEQPKAAGSSLLAKLTNLLVADALSAAGFEDLGAVTVLPLATGMALTVTLLALKATRPAGARYVIWPRIDQKTCLKAIISAGLEAVVVANKLEGDQLRTDEDQIKAEISRLGPENVVCVVTTTSCFAPRAADRVVEVAKLCAAENVGHIVNNAYGVQSAALCKLITSAWRKGRVDAVVQSTDKNFMVPVGGAVVAASKKAPALVHAVNSAYPGRASMAPLLDVLITLLHWGRSGWLQALAEREALYQHLHLQLSLFAERHGTRVLQTPDNPISLALSLSNMLTSQPTTARQQQAQDASCSESASEIAGSHSSPGPEPLQQQSALAGSGDEAGKLMPSASSGPQTDAQQVGSGSTIGEPSMQHVHSSERSTEHSPASSAQPSMQDGRNVTFLGSMLFKRCISGTRVVARAKQQKVAGHSFTGYGAHCDDYPCDYLTVAAALGTTTANVDEFLKRLGRCLDELKSQNPRDGFA